MMKASAVKGDSASFLLWGAIFAVSMAFLESSVVVYLREIYYPGQYHLFPLKIMVPSLFRIELLREISTLLMLISVATIISIGKRDFKHSFFYNFAFLFGLWDIFYYIFLRLLIGWPGSVMEWDVLFLIPIIWIGPVIAPSLVALILVLAGVWGVRRLGRGEIKGFNAFNLSLITVGSFVLFLSFIWLPLGWLFESGIGGISSQIPSHFPWLIYLPGLFIFSIGIFHPLRSASKIKNT